MSKLLLYHGSNLPIQRPDVLIGRSNLDFGQGFYLTNLQEQAERWAMRVGKDSQAVVSCYELDLESAIQYGSYKKFEFYDEEWLTFIIQNRLGQCTEQYDIIEGGIANDRVIDTIEAYMAGMMPLDLALEELSKHAPNNQVCISNQVLLEQYLHFVHSYTI